MCVSIAHRLGFVLLKSDAWLKSYDPGSGVDDPKSRVSLVTLGSSYKFVGTRKSRSTDYQRCKAMVEV